MAVWWFVGLVVVWFAGLVVNNVGMCVFYVCYGFGSLLVLVVALRFVCGCLFGVVGFVV